MLGLSVSNLLDRSFETTSRGQQQVGDSLLATTRTRSRATAPSATCASRLHGRRSHGCMSARRRTRSRATTASATRRSSTTARGSRASSIRRRSATPATRIRPDSSCSPGKAFSLAGSYRKGGNLSLKRGDTTLANAHVPDRLAFSAAFLGIRGNDDRRSLGQGQLVAHADARLNQFAHHRQLGHERWRRRARPAAG